MHVNELPKMWRYKSNIFRKAKDFGAAYAFEKCAEDLEAAQLPRQTLEADTCSFCEKPYYLNAGLQRYTGCFNCKSGKI